LGRRGKDGKNENSTTTTITTPNSAVFDLTSSIHLLLLINPSLIPDKIHPRHATMFPPSAGYTLDIEAISGIMGSISIGMKNTS
jgi:hypothetical protein